jgi:hypothetical protein
MRRDKPSRHGRAADALIASYVRELLVDEPNEPADMPQRALVREPDASAALLGAPEDQLKTDAAL